LIFELIVELILEFAQSTQTHAYKYAPLMRIENWNFESKERKK